MKSVCRSGRRKRASFRPSGESGPIQPTGPGVERIEGATRGGGGCVIFVTPIPSSGTPPTRWAYVLYEGILLLNPSWVPLRANAMQFVIGLVLLVLGGAAATVGWRRRRREAADRIEG